MAADRIVDRLVHVEHRIERRGDSPPKNPRLAVRKERKDH